VLPVGWGVEARKGVYPLPPERVGLGTGLGTTGDGIGLVVFCCRIGDGVGGSGSSKELPSCLKSVWLNAGLYCVFPLGEDGMRAPLARELDSVPGMTVVVEYEA